MKRFSKEDIENIKIGDILPNCFGQMKEVTKITFRGKTPKGKLFVGVRQQFSDNSTLTNTYTEGKYPPIIGSTS